MAPPKLVTPAVLMVRLKAPLTVPPRVILPLPLELSSLVPPRVTASLYDWASVVITEPPLSAVEPAASVVRLTKAVLPPTAPLRVVTPALLIVRVKAPLTAPARVILPLPLELRLVFAPKVTA